MEVSRGPIHREGALARLGSVVRELGCRRVFLVSDPGVVEAGWTGVAARSLARAAIEFRVFDRVGENPTTRHVDAGVREARERGPFDAIVAVGGGSAMDCAKAVNMVLTNHGRVEDYRGYGKAARAMLPAVGVPTTAGTGSEAQSYALISDAGTNGTKRKMACGDPGARFAAVILDPDTLATVPRPVAAAAGLDAVAHAVESFVSTRAGELARGHARKAWQLLEGSLEIHLDHPEDPAARSRMQTGAYRAGAAIEASMLGAAHALANPLTCRHGIAHGVAVALMLPHVVAWNAAAAGQLYGELSRAAGLPPNADALVARLLELNAAARLPARLRELNVGLAELPRLADAAAAEWTAGFNPRPVGVSELRRLYEAAH